jgi:hypothetical protein
MELGICKLEGFGTAHFFLSYFLFSTLKHPSLATSAMVSIGNDFTIFSLIF